MATQREARISQKIQAELRGMGAFCFKVHGSQFMMAGLPDIVGVYRGLFFGFETKTPEKRKNTSASQDRVHGLIREAGGFCEVVCSPTEAVEKLREYADCRSIKVKKQKP